MPERRDSKAKTKGFCVVFSGCQSGAVAIAKAINLKKYFPNRRG